MTKSIQKSDSCCCIEVKSFDNPSLSITLRVAGFALGLIFLIATYYMAQQGYPSNTGISFATCGGALILASVLSCFKLKTHQSSRKNEKSFSNNTLSPFHLVHWARGNQQSQDPLNQLTDEKLNPILKSNLHYCENGMNLLHIAAWYGLEEKCKRLVSLEANVQALTLGKKNLLHLVLHPARIMTDFNEHFSCIKTIVDLGVAINGKDKDGYTPLDCFETYLIELNNNYIDYTLLCTSIEKPACTPKDYIPILEYLREKGAKYSSELTNSPDKS